MIGKYFTIKAIIYHMHKRARESFQNLKLAAYLIIKTMQALKMKAFNFAVAHFSYSAHRWTVASDANASAVQGIAAGAAVAVVKNRHGVVCAVTGDSWNLYFCTAIRLDYHNKPSIHLSIHLLSEPLFPHNGHGRAEAYPSSLWADGTP